MMGVGFDIEEVHEVRLRLRWLYVLWLCSICSVGIYDVEGTNGMDIHVGGSRDL